MVKEKTVLRMGENSFVVQQEQGRNTFEEVEADKVFEGM